MRIRLAVFAGAAVLLTGAPPAGAATFTVTNTNNSGGGSLRQAIIDANAAAGKDLISFTIPGSGLHVIAPSPALPATTDPVVIDASTQPGYSGTPLIQLKGPGSTGNGLDIQGGGSTVRGLDIVGWQHGIRILMGDGNVIADNVIGADPTGRFALPNYHGIAIRDSDENRIGGKTAADRNLISGNLGDGIVLTNIEGVVYASQSENRNVILGNYIGTTAGGASALPNNYGVVVEDAATGNVIGATSGGGNVISGNTGDGVFVVGDVDPLQRPNKTQVVSNKIGVNANGGAALGNGRMGIEVIRADRTAIGGVPLDAGNVVSGNALNGIALYAALYTTIGGNTIGTNAAETAAVGNGWNGVSLHGSTGFTRVGGFMAGSAIYGAPNLISGNAADGVEIEDSSSNSVLSNRIGTNGAGTAAIGNGLHGVAIVANQIPAQNNKVGQLGAGNLISGNAFAGVYLNGARNRDQGGTGATQNQVVDNTIGTNAAGNNPIGNLDGVQTNKADANTISDNLIAGNRRDGVSLGVSVGDVVLRNQIGIAGAFGNLGNGVGIYDAVGLLVKDNTIVGNLGAGVNVSGGVQDKFTTNSMFSNGALGIDLGADGVTPNDLNDSDSGANTLLNTPTLTLATVQNGMVTINGGYGGAASTTLTIELFANNACDPSGYGEGKTYLGQKTVTTNGNGAVVFSATFALPYSSPRLTATAIDKNGNTSEFSNCIIPG